MNSTYTLASARQRLANYVFDIIGLYIFGFIIGFIIGLTGITDSITIGYNITYGFGVVVMLLYYILFESIWQRTPGKFITKTKVVSEHGTKPTFGQILGRSFLRFIPFEAFTFMSLHPQGWHDRFAKTMVVPNTYTVEDVQKIDLQAVRKEKFSKIVLTFIILLIVIAVLGIISSIFFASLSSVKENMDSTTQTSSDSSPASQY